MWLLKKNYSSIISPKYFDSPDIDTSLFIRAEAWLEQFIRAEAWFLFSETDAGCLIDV